jgi:endonuclease YncB( thermonuclease family)
MNLIKPFALKVLDGDTLDCILPCTPFTEVLVNRRLRLYGIDTPEKNTDAGKFIIEWLTWWLSIHNDVVRVQYITADKFSGRFVGQVWVPYTNLESPTEVRSVTLSSLLISNGMAKSFTGKEAKIPWTQQELRNAERAARSTPVRIGTPSSQRMSSEQHWITCSRQTEEVSFSRPTFHQEWLWYPCPPVDEKSVDL